MLCRLRKNCLALAVAIGMSAYAAAPALAIGYYNLPGNFCQCFGYGNGGGYHSCMVLGPSHCHGFCTPHDVRLPCPPQPPRDHCGYGNYGGNYSGGETYRVPELAPSAAIQPRPANAAIRPQILR